MPRPNPVRVSLQLPQTAEGQRALDRRVAAVHAQWVVARLEKLACPSEQKAQLLDAVLRAARKEK